VLYFHIVKIGLKISLIVDNRPWGRVCDNYPTLVPTANSLVSHTCMNSSDE
jgi:hypothetical protein